MTEAAPYPQTAQVADELIVNQLKMVHAEVKDGFGRQERHNDKLDARFESMVTKAEFRSEVRRLDAEHGHLRDSVTKGLEASRKEMREGFQRIHDEDKSRTTKTRWFTGTLLTCAGLVSGLVFNIISSLSR